jgi:hypothetical protein
MLAGIGVIIATSAVKADIIYLNQIVDVNGQGFGNAPRLITVQAQGNNSTESGAIGIVGGALTAVAGINNASVFSGERCHERRRRRG